MDRIRRTDFILHDRWKTIGKVVAQHVFLYTTVAICNIVALLLKLRITLQFLNLWYGIKTYSTVYTWGRLTPSCMTHIWIILMKVARAFPPVIEAATAIYRS